MACVLMGGQLKLIVSLVYSPTNQTPSLILLLLLLDSFLLLLLMRVHPLVSRFRAFEHLRTIGSAKIPIKIHIKVRIVYE